MFDVLLGSWGDLLSATQVPQKDKERDRKYSGRKGEGDAPEHSPPFCQKIPLTNGLYLETHTHVKKSQSADANVKSGEITSRPKSARCSKSCPRNSVKERDIDAPDNVDDTPKKRREPYSISIPSAPPPPNLPPPIANIESTVAQLENLRLEKENKALRFEAAKLVEDMNRARAEYLECCNTMKELHNIAEILKRDNFNLLQKHQHQQTVEGKLIQALAENRQMKELLETIAQKQGEIQQTTEGQGIQTEQLSQIRNVIK